MSVRRFIPIALLLLLVLLDLMSGSLRSPGWDVISLIRIPRMLTALLAGASLGLAGLQMQSLFRNPLADPHIMGVSGAAGFAVALSITSSTLMGFSLGSLGSVAAAWAGSIICSFLIIWIAGRGKGATTLLLFGVMLGFVFSALTTIVGYTATEQSLKSYYNWAAGSFSGTGYQQISIIACTLTAGLLLASFTSRGLDLSLFGDEYTAITGARSSRIRLFSILSASLLTAGVTAFCGPIGFAGIVAPHLARYFAGTSRHAATIPQACICGAVLTLAADALSQCSGVVLPVGSTLALMGIPFICYILLKKGNA